MTDSDCRGWDSKKSAWTGTTSGTSGKGKNTGNHAERQAYAGQKTACTFYEFTQSTFPCAEDPIYGCHYFFLKASEKGVGFQFIVAENKGGYLIPPGHYINAETPPNPGKHAPHWQQEVYRKAMLKLEQEPFVLVTAAVKADSGILYFHNGKAYFNAKPHDFPEAK